MFFFFERDRDDESISVGAKCKIVAVHMPLFSDSLGRRVVIAEVDRKMRMVWAYDDKPIRYKLNRQGTRVIDFNPRCILSCYSFDQLEVISP
jgi:hypothetical protein